MSDTGIEPCTGIVPQKIALICSFVCFCENRGKQVCVDGLIITYNSITEKSSLLVEHPYYVPKLPVGLDKNNKVKDYKSDELKPYQPVPLISSGGVDDMVFSLGRWLGLARLAKTPGISNEIMEDYLQKKTRYKDIREQGNWDIAKYQKGELSIPDTVIVEDRDKPAIGDNVLAVAEVKFPPDDWHEGQYEAACRIAGGESNVHTLTPKSCQCNESGEQELDKSLAKEAARIAQVKEEKEKIQKYLDLALATAGLAQALAGAAATRNPALITHGFNQLEHAWNSIK